MHVLLDCPHPRNLRGTLRKKVHDTFNRVSSLWEASSKEGKIKPDSASRARTVAAVKLARPLSSVTMKTARGPQHALASF